MNARVFLLGVFTAIALGTIAGGFSSDTNWVVPATPYDPLKNPMLDAETMAMINKWPRGADTNGLYCAINIVNDWVGFNLNCAVNIINTTTNFYRTILGLPREANLQIELLDSSGTPVEKTSAGKLFQTWPESKMDTWVRQALRNRSRGTFFAVWSVAYTQVYSFRIPEIFNLKEPGEYTLHLRYELVEAKFNSSQRYEHLKTLWLPEVVATIHIHADDLRPPGASASQTNGPPVVKANSPNSLH